MKRAPLFSGFLTLISAAIALAVVGHPSPFGFDVTATRALQTFSLLTIPMEIVSLSASSAIWQGLAVGVICLVIARLGLKREALALLLVASGEFLLNGLIKWAIHRPRPTVADVQVFGFVGGYSFPSGHVMFYTAFYGGLFLLAMTKLRRGIGRTTVMVVCAMLVGLVGASRMYLGAHWASDVAAAYALGAAWLFAVGHPLWRSAPDASAQPESTRRSGGKNDVDLAD